MNSSRSIHLSPPPASPTLLAFSSATYVSPSYDIYPAPFSPPLLFSFIHLPPLFLLCLPAHIRSSFGATLISLLPFVCYSLVSLTPFDAITMTFMLHQHQKPRGKYQILRKPTKMMMGYTQRGLAGFCYNFSVGFLLSMSDFH